MRHNKIEGLRSDFEYLLEIAIHEAWLQWEYRESGHANDSAPGTIVPTTIASGSANARLSTERERPTVSEIQRVQIEGELPEIDRRALGTSRLIDQKRLENQGYEEGDFWLGRTLNGKAFGWTEDLNLLTCAGPRAGKGVSSVVPNLLEFPGAAIVVDPKGELASLTAAYRHRELGHRVVVLDPAGIADVPDELRGTYNPLAGLDAKDPKVITMAQTIASGLVVPNPAAKEPYWDDNAIDFIQSCILYMVLNFPPEDRTLVKLREVVSVGDRELYARYLAMMREDHPEFEESLTGPFDMMIRDMTSENAFGGILRETASKISQMGEAGKGSVLGTARTHLDFLKAPELWESLADAGEDGRTFDLSELRKQDRPLTVYLCLPVEMIPRQGRWLRLIVTQAIHYIERTGPSFDKHRDLPILMMLDEFFQLGPIPSIVNTLTFAPGFGLRLWLIVQDLGQLKRNNGDSWETIFGACGIKQFFGINDMFTAKYVSELLGETEIDVPSISLTNTASESATESESESLSRNSSVSVSENESTSSGTNWSTGQSSSVGYSTSSSTGSSSGSNGSVSGGSNGMASGWNTGQNQGQSSSLSYTESVSSSRGGSDSVSVGTTRGQSIGEGSSQTRGTGSSTTAGQNWTLSYGKQVRRVDKPEELTLAFTKNNLLQLTHIRDLGGCLLFRTPFYADPFFNRRLLPGD
jgi:type IV secretion system protein VirD4